MLFLNTAFCFFSLLQYYHDKMVVDAYRSRIEAEDKEQLIVSEYENGIATTALDELNFKIQRVRQIRDILDNSVRDLYKVDDAVTQWVDSLGGYRKVQEEILGLSLGKNGWYARICKELENVLGGTPSALGLPSADIHTDSATSHTSYSVQVHRDLANQQAYGEYHDLDEISTPNWALSDQDFDVQRVEGVQAYRKTPVSAFYTSKDVALPKDELLLSAGEGMPYWWKHIYMGRFRIGRVADNAPKTMKQNETSVGPLWVPDIRLSAVDPDGDGWVDVPFKHITAVGKWYLMQENATVKEFIHRFYNQPKRLFWKKIGYGEKVRWACGMITPRGQYIWSPLAYKSSNKLDWYKENEGKSWTPKRKRALYVRDNYGDWVIQYGKQGDFIRVIKMKSNDATGMFEIWKDINMTWQEWGKAKKILLKMGGRDAYLGYPDTPYKVPEQYVNNIEI